MIEDHHCEWSNDNTTLGPQTGQLLITLIFKVLLIMANVSSAE